LESIGKFRGYENPRNIVYWKERGELIVGHSKGNIAIYRSELINKGPISSVKAHKGEVVWIGISPDRSQLVSSGKDCSLKVTWLLNSIGNLLFLGINSRVIELKRI